MKQHSKRLLSVLLALALVLSLFPGVALTATAADPVNFVQTSAEPTAAELENMETFDYETASALYNSADFQALGGSLGLIGLIYGFGETDGTYKVIENILSGGGQVRNRDCYLDDLLKLIRYEGKLYYVEKSGSETPNPAVYYRYYILNTSNWTVSPAVSSTTDYTLVSTGDANGSWDGGWHVMNENVVLNGNLKLTGTVYLILCDGASLTVTRGLYSNTPGTRLVIYPGFMSSGTRSAPEIQGTGTLTATGTQGRSAIGYELSLEVHGGVIEANGFRFAAGIGGIAGKDGCDVVIYDGTVNATGGENAAGIGGGSGGSGGNVEIYGGTVNAVSGADDVAGIGAGAGGSEQGTLRLSGTELSVSNDGETWTPASDSSVRGRYMRVQAIDPNAPVSADAGYTEDFEGANTWTLQNGDRTNAWVVGEAVNNGGSKALYISNDDGVSNAYYNGESAFVFAEKRFRFDGGDYDFAYDWRNNGENGYDFLRVALIPDSAEVGPGTYYSGFGNSALPSGWIDLDGGFQLRIQKNWQHMSVVGKSVPAGVYRVAFLWRNDGGGGSDPPAAVDNFSVVPSGSTAVSVSSVTVSPDALNLSAGDTATLAATVLPADADQTVVWTSSDPSVATVDDNGVVTAVGPGNAEITVTATNGTEDASDDVAASCTVTVAAPEVTYFKGYSLSLRGDIALYFYIDLNDIAPEDATVHFTWGNGPVRNSLDRALSEITPVAVGDASYYPVSVPVSAAEINDKITAVLMNGGDTVETDEASVADYARRIIANKDGEFNEGYAALPELQALCEAMLIYGAKAQLQFGYNTGDLADAGMDYTLEDADPASISGGTVEKDLSAFGLEYFGSTLQLQSTVTHRVYFKVVNQAKLDATNVRYGSRELTKASVTDKRLIGNPEGEYIYIDLVDVTARRVTSPYTMTFTNGKKTVKMNVNAATYIKQALNGSDATLRTTVTALYNYNQAAVAYFEARDAQ